MFWLMKIILYIPFWILYPCRIKGKILNYLNKMNIDGISYGIIDKLYEYDLVTSIKDLYKLEKKTKKIIDIEGFGTKSVLSWIDSINDKRTVQDYILLGSLGIEGVSKKTFEKIMVEMTIDELIDLVENNNISRLVSIPSIQDKTANKIIEGIKENKKLIDFLQDELTILSSKGGNDKLYSVCFTKIRDEEKEKFIESTNGQVVDSLTKNTTFLVVPSLDIESSKVSKAKKYGIRVIQIDDLETAILTYLDNLK